MSCNVEWDWGPNKYDASEARKRRGDGKIKRNTDDREQRARALLKSRENELMAVRTIWHGILAAKMRVRHDR